MLEWGRHGIKDLLFAVYKWRKGKYFIQNVVQTRANKSEILLAMNVKFERNNTYYNCKDKDVKKKGGDMIV